MRSIVVVVLAGLTLVPGARGADTGRPPDAVGDANAVSTPAGFGSGCANGPTSGVCADRVWPPAGLGTPLPVSAGSVIHVTFTSPVDLRTARVGGRDASFAAESPTVWRITVPDALGDGLVTLSTLWRSGDWHGDQVYALPVGPPATLIAVRGARATVAAHGSGGVCLALVRARRTLRSRCFAVAGPGVRHYALRRAAGARLRVTFAPTAGRRVVLAS